MAMQPATAGPAPGFSSGAPRDLAHMLDESRWSGFQKLVLAFLAMVFAVDGLANQSLGIAMPALIEDWGLAKDAFATVGAANLTGVAIGPVLGGLVGDRIGRRGALIGAVLLFGLMTAAGALTANPMQLMVVRFVDGLGIGAAIPNGAALISEFTPRNRRGRAIAIGMVFIPVGGILAGGLGASVLEVLGWKAVMLVAGALPVVLALAFFLFLPESPSFLLRAGKRDTLNKVLRRCRIDHQPGEDYVIPPMEKSVRAPLRILVTDDLRRKTFLMWLGFFTCLMASYTIFSWVPTMLHTLEFSLTMTSLSITPFHSGGMVGALFSGWLLDKSGFSRTHFGLAMVATGLAAALAAVLGGGINEVVLVLPLMMALGFCMAGLHNTLYTLAATAYPTSARATGVGVASAVGRIGAVLSSFTGVISLNIGGSFGFFALVAILLAVCGVAGLLVRSPITEKA